MKRIFRAILFVASLLLVAGVHAQPPSVLDFPPPPTENSDSNRPTPAPHPPVSGERFSGAMPARQPAAKRPARPSVGVVFAGGGAAGLCHVGILKTLEQYGIPIDSVCGTSMGSIVAGLYATGRSPLELEEIVNTFPWDDVLSEPPKHHQKYERRKTDDYLFPPSINLGVDHGSARLGAGFVSGQELTLKLRRLLANTQHIDSFDQLPTPFRAVAVDLETGEQVVFRKGSMATAIRASMSIPGVFPPVEHQGRILVDGGVVNNLPSDVARIELGADILIIVQLPAHLKTKNELKSFLSISSQSLRIVQANTPSNRPKGMRTGDILIRPELNGISTLDFDRAQEAVALGEAAARKHHEQLMGLAQYLRQFGPIHTGRRRQSIPMDIVVDDVQIENDSNVVTDAAIAARLSVRPGVPLTLGQLERDIGRINGLAAFGTVDYEIGPLLPSLNPHGGNAGEYPAVECEWSSHLSQPSLPDSDPSSYLDVGQPLGLRIMATEPNGKTLLTLGLGFEDNFSGDAAYTTSAALTFRGLNRLAGEARLFGQIGSRQRFLADFFQPIDPSLRWFVRPYAEYRGRLQPFTLDNARVADLNIRTVQGGIDFGRTIGESGVITAGVFGGHERLLPRTGFPALFEGAVSSSDFTAFFFGAKHDSLDSYFLPGHGFFAESTYTQYDTSVDGVTDNIYARVIAANTWGRNRVIFRGEALYDDVVAGSRVGVEGASGGFLRLTGYGNNAIITPRRYLAALMFLRRSYSLFGDRVQLYSGVTAELGYFEGAGGDANVVTNRPIIAGSVFTAANTPIGPIFAGYGRTDSNQDSLFVALGQVF